MNTKTLTRNFYGDSYEDFHTNEEIAHDLDIWTAKASAIEKNRIIDLMIYNKNVQIARIQKELHKMAGIESEDIKSESGHSNPQVPEVNPIMHLLELVRSAKQAEEEILGGNF